MNEKDRIDEKQQDQSTDDEKRSSERLNEDLAVEELHLSDYDPGF